MTEIREWLAEDPPASVIAKLTDGDQEVEYIPIGQIESMLDEKFNWDTKEFRFNIYKTGTYWFATGSVELALEEISNLKPEYYAGALKEVPLYRRNLTGAATIAISSRDDNMHYESTILSLATANAAQKLGKRFGRELNNRMKVGETSFTNKLDVPPVIDRGVERLKILIENAQSLQALAVHKEAVATSDSPELIKSYADKVKKLSL